MVRIARRDTYGLEDIGGVKVRRRIFAGQRVPEHLEVQAGALEEPDVPEPEPEEPMTKPKPGPEASPAPKASGSRRTRRSGS